jgi:hypothetical protein
MAGCQRFPGPWTRESTAPLAVVIPLLPLLHGADQPGYLPDSSAAPQAFPRRLRTFRKVDIRGQASRACRLPVAVVQ